nr:transposase (putative), gypsy type [Tanacetum cinerariifolium]
MSFSKRPRKNTPQCYTKPLDSLKNWNNRFFWVDERVFPTVVDWRTNASKDEMLVNGTYSVEAVRALDTHRTPIQKQPEMLLCLVGISRRYYLVDVVYTTFHYDDDRGEDWELPPCPHKVPLLMLTASRVIEMDEPAIATDSSGVPSAIEKSSLDFAHEDGASYQGTDAPEMPSPEDVPATATPRVGQAEEAVAAEPPVARESRKEAMMGLTLMLLQSAPADVSDPDPLSFVDAPSHHPIDVAQDPESENVSSPAKVGSPGSVYQPELGVTNGSLLDTPEACQDLVDHAAPLGSSGIAVAPQVRSRGKAAEEIRGPEDKSVGLIKELEDMRAWFSDLQVSGEEKLKVAFEEFKRYEDERVKRRPQVVIGHGLRLAMMKCVESLEMRQAFADVVSAEVAKGMSEGLKHGVEHGQTQLTVESIEAYDLEAEAKFIAALQSLKDLKYPFLDQLEGLKDAPMDVIMAALYLERDTRGMPHNIYATSTPVPLSSPSPCTRRSDDVPVSVPTMVPQGLALFLVDAATQTDLQDA